MKTIKTITAMLLLIAFVFFGCKKEEHNPDHKTVTGTVTYLNGATGNYENASGAIVTMSGTASTTATTGSSGSYSTTLPEGSYTFTAEYTDDNGFKYKSGSYSVTIGTDGNALTVNLSTK